MSALLKPPAQILVVEDDGNLRTTLLDNLEEEGWQVQGVSRCAEAEQVLAGRSIDLLILDLMLPDGDGYSLCRRLRAGGCRAMILMLTARTLEDDLVRGFEAGADDYLTKPYRLRELLMRVKALLARERGPAEHDRVRFGTFELDRSSRTLKSAKGDALDLTRTEFDLLALLLTHTDRVLTRDEILDQVWGAGVVVDGRTVDNFVSSLKKKLGWTAESPFRIRTVRGIGYRMELDREA